MSTQTDETQDQKNKSDDNSGQPEPKQESKEQSPKDKAKRRRALIIFAVVLLVAIVAGVLYWLHARHFEDTDDAQVDGNLSPIGSRIDGTVTKVYVQDDQVVHMGDPLVDLDPQDNQVAFDQAEAELAQARSQLTAQLPNIPITQVQNASSISSAQAEVASAIAAAAGAERDREQAAAKVLQQQAANNRAQADFQRYKLLIEKQEVSKMEYDQYDANAKQQAANLEATQAALLSAQRTVEQRGAQLDEANSKLVENQRTAPRQILIRRANVEGEQANIKSSQAQLEQARLNLTYAKITSPVDGIVMRRSAQVGARVTKGQQLLSISEINDLWITANFKETQLGQIRTGQHVTVHVDALDRDFDGSIAAIGGATGSVSGVLPAENATGNYVKVVQRIPVRINLNPNQDGLNQLRPGMSAEPKVRISQ